MCGCVLHDIWAWVGKLTLKVTLKWLGYHWETYHMSDYWARRNWRLGSAMIDKSTYTWPLHVIWPLYRQLLIVNDLYRASFDLESEVRGILLLDSIGQKILWNARYCCGNFGKIQSATLCFFWLISLIDWLLFSFHNE